MKSVEGPNGRLYPDHAPKTVCLIGMGPSIQDYLGETLTQELKPEHHDEVWGINMVGNCVRCDLIFWTDDLEQQKNYQPHKLIPTVNVKNFVRENGQTIADICGEEVGRWMQGILGMPEEVAGEVYNDVVEDMKTLVNKGSLIKLPHEMMLRLGQAYGADGQAGKPDPSRDLTGLLQMLDRHKTPVMSAIRYPEIIENSFDYPIDEIAQLSYDIFRKPYLNNGVAMAIAYAMWKGVKTLRIYGCDFTYPNRDFAESGRACVESWLTAAVLKDINIGVAPHSSVFDMVGEGAIYGYKTQPTLTMSDGTVFRYDPNRHNGRFGGQFLTQSFYQPEDSSGRKASNVVPFSAQADGSAHAGHAGNVGAGNGVVKAGNSAGPIHA